jgi:hypothetical protein
VTQSGRRAGPARGQRGSPQQLPSVRLACERTQQPGLEEDFARRKPRTSDRGGRVRRLPQGHPG